MQHPAFAPTDAVIEQVHVAVGRYIPARTPLVSFSPDSQRSTTWLG